VVRVHFLPLEWRQMPLSSGVEALAQENKNAQNQRQTAILAEGNSEKDTHRSGFSSSQGNQ
jgi:hypothetical protein